MLFYFAFTPNTHTVQDDFIDKLEQEKQIKDNVRVLINTICKNENDSYPNICKFCTRSVDDERIIVERVFEKIIEPGSTMSAEAAISFIENDLNY